MKTNLSEKIEIFGAEYVAYLENVTRYVVKNNGSIADAKDLYHDALIVLLAKLNQDDFLLTASLKTYIIAICKNLWLKRLGSSKGRVEFEENKYIDFFDELSNDIE